MIGRIEREEWHHRQVLAQMLAELGGRPRPLREALMASLGALIGLSCRVSWLLPMLGAGLIERGNVRVYRRLVRCAVAADRPDLAATLAALGQVEVDHAVWFFERVGEHWLGRRLTWLGPTAAERTAFAAPGGAP